MRSSRAFRDRTRSHDARRAKLVWVDQHARRSFADFRANRSGRSMRHGRFSCGSIELLGVRGSMIAAVEWLAARGRGDVRASRSTFSDEAERSS
jgi:hypothetical protein